MPSTAKKEPKESTGAVEKKDFKEVIKQFEEDKKKVIAQAQSKMLLHDKKRDRVAICGFAPNTKNLAPFQDDEVEIWACNELYEHIPRVDVLFEMHDRSEFESTFRNQRHLDWLRASKVPIYMVKHYDDIPMSIPYPLQSLTARFGTYFNNTISYMIVLAVMMKYKWVGIYGVDMAHKTEYSTQRPSCEYFIGWMRGLAEVQGFPTVHLPEESELLKTAFLYGYVNGNKMSKIINQKKDHLVKQHQHYTNQEMLMRDIKNQHVGAVQTLEDLGRTLIHT